MGSKTVDVVERAVWTLVQGGTGIAVVQDLQLPVWVAAVVAGGLSVVKTVLGKLAPVVAESATVAAEPSGETGQVLSAG